MRKFFSPIVKPVRRTYFDGTAKAFRAHIVKDQSTLRQQTPSTSSLWCDVLGIDGGQEIVQALLDAMLTLVTTKDQTERANAVRKIKDINTALTAEIQAVNTNINLPLTPQRLAVLLRSSGLSQGEFAEAIEISQSNVSEWIKGTRPIPQKHAGKIYKICLGSFVTQIRDVQASILGSSSENQSAA